MNHACNTTTKGGIVTKGKSIIEQTWEKIDSRVDEIMALNAKVRELDEAKAPDMKGYIDRLAFAKGAATGLAEVLALMTVPHFRTPAEISTEAGERWKARQAGVPHVTPGLGS